MDFHDPLTTYDPVCLKAIEAFETAFKDVNMNRAPRVVSTEVEVQGKTFPLFTFNKDLAESIIRVIDTTPVPQADGDSGDSPSEGGLLKSGMFEHLPEWP
jgi:hypothetical protein